MEFKMINDRSMFLPDDGTVEFTSPVDESLRNAKEYWAIAGLPTEDTD